MISKETNMIIKILGVIGAIFILVAQFTPWGVRLYLFGADFIFQFDWFYVSFFETGIWQFILIAIIMIILFFVNLVILLLSVQAIVRLNTNGLNIYQKLPIYVTVEFILYIVGFSIASGGITGYGIVSVGFVMVLIAMIIFWIIFALAKSQGLITAPMFHQPAYHSPAYQQHPPVHQPTYPPPPQQAPPQQQSPPPAQSPPQQPQNQQPQANATPKFCSQCGAPLVPNTKFCSQCGNKL